MIISASPGWNLKRDRAVAKQVAALVLSVQAECLAEPPGTAGKIAVARPSPSRSGDLQAVDHLAGPHQHSAADSLGSAADVSRPSACRS